MGIPYNSNADPAALTTQFTGRYESPAVNDGPKRWARYGSTDFGSSGGGQPQVNPNSYAAAGAGVSMPSSPPTSIANAPSPPPSIANAPSPSASMQADIGGPVQSGTYNGEPYTFQTQPALGPQSMLQAPQMNPLAAALSGQGNPLASPALAPWAVAGLDLGGGQYGFG